MVTMVVATAALVKGHLAGLKLNSFLWPPVIAAPGADFTQFLGFFRILTGTLPEGVKQLICHLRGNVVANRPLPAARLAIEKSFDLLAFDLCRVERRQHPPHTAAAIGLPQRPKAPTVRTPKPQPGAAAT